MLQPFGKYKVRHAAAAFEDVAADRLAGVRGTVSGTITPRAGGDTLEVRDRFLTVHRRDGGAWRVSRLMWTPIGGGS